MRTLPILLAIILISLDFTTSFVQDGNNEAATIVFLQIEAVTRQLIANNERKLRALFSHNCYAAMTYSHNRMQPFMNHFRGGRMFNVVSADFVNNRIRADVFSMPEGRNRPFVIQVWMSRVGTHGNHNIPQTGWIFDSITKHNMG